MKNTENIKKCFRLFSVLLHFQEIIHYRVSLIQNIFVHQISTHHKPNISRGRGQKVHEIMLKASEA
jgi:hypothetical protein